MDGRQACERRRRAPEGPRCSSHTVIPQPLQVMGENRHRCGCGAVVGNLRRRVGLLICVMSWGARVGLAQVCDASKLAAESERLIRSNYAPELGGTVPSGDCSPYLSSTESVWAAYAYSHFDLVGAMAELRASLIGQWDSGLIPKIRFPGAAHGPWLNGTIYPGPEIWRAPVGYTAGLAAMPWFAIAAMQIFNQRRDDSGLLFLESVFQPIFMYHKYLHQQRAAGDDLVLSYHPWESDMPTDSPIWRQVLNSTEQRIADVGWSPSYDHDLVSSLPGYPGTIIFDAEMYLVELMANASYVDASIVATSPFVVLDVEFNAVLAAADSALSMMARVLQLHSSSVVSESARQYLSTWSSTSTTRLDRLWTGSRYASQIIPSSSSPAAVSEAAPGSAVGRGARHRGSSSHDLTSISRRAVHSRMGVQRQDSRAVVLPAGTPYPLNLVTTFFPLYVGGLSSERRQGLTFEMLQPTGVGSFDCPHYNYRIPTVACSFSDDKPAVSVLHNLVVERGLARSQDSAAFAMWLRAQTVNLICNASMDYFAPGTASGPFLFHRYFHPVSGDPLNDVFGNTSTLAAAVAMNLLYADAEAPIDNPPISHNVTFALVVIELIIAFATGVGCFVFSLHLFRKLRTTDEDTPMPMLNVHESDDEHVDGGYQTFPPEREAAAGGEISEDQQQSGQQQAAASNGTSGWTIWSSIRSVVSYLKPA